MVGAGLAPALASCAITSASGAVVAPALASCAITSASGAVVAPTLATGAITSPERRYIAFNACSMSSPIEPSPTTMTLSPGASGVRATARRQQARGSTNEPSSALSVSGSGSVACSTCAADTRIYSAKPHGSMFEVLNDTHIDGLPCRQ